MTRTVSARRAQVQEKRAKRQLIMAVFGALVLGIVFVFFLMPILFSFIISLSRNGKPTQTQGDVIPPQRPVLQPPAEFTNQKALTLMGFTEPRADVQLYLDSGQNSVVKADDDGKFTFTLDLEEAPHELWVAAADEAGNLSVESEHYQVTVDLTTPTVEILQPEDGVTFTLPRERTQTVKGKVSEKAQVRVNGALTQTDNDGNFSVTIQLAQGKNEIVVSAADPAGNAAEEKKISVEYQP